MILKENIFLLNVWLFLLREILDNVYIVLVCESGSAAISFEINLSF